jgi:hypothetical protein
MLNFSTEEGFYIYLRYRGIMVSTLILVGALEAHMDVLDHGE